MRLKLSKLAFLPLALAVACGSLAVPAAAGSHDAGYRDHDRVYADKFGNLVIYSRAGYKRIIVGAGHLANQVSSRNDAGEDAGVVYYNGSNDDGDVVLPGDCWKPAVLLKGRSYMYGLADGELPDLPGKCRN